MGSLAFIRERHSSDRVGRSCWCRAEASRPANRSRAVWGASRGSSSPVGRALGHPGEAGRELAQWGTRASHDRTLGPDVLLLGLLAWTRMHGIISLEIEGVFDQVGVDAARLYDQGIKHLITQRTGKPTR
jgi:Tetracyclin repressor-like, C-terminal domain